MRLEPFGQAIGQNPFIVAIVIAVLALLAVWMLPKWCVRHLTSLSEKDRFECENESRKTIAQVIAGALLLAGLYFTAQTLRVNQETLLATQERQVTEQYLRAVEQIGHSSLQVRLGGIYALERVAAESPLYQPIVSDVLGAFVRDRVPWGGHVKARARDRLGRRLAIDIAAAVTTIVRSRPVQADFVQTRRPCVSPEDRLYIDDGCIVFRGPPPSIPDDAELRRWFIDLSATNLAGLLLFPESNLSYASLSFSNLERASLSGCRLIAVWLVDARLVGADLENVRLNLANLNGANFEGANLRNADLRRASLWRTNLRGAELTGAQLQGVDLTTVVGLTQAQISGAVTDQTTKLPNYIH
jgi:hypothetical protein